MADLSSEKKWKDEQMKKVVKQIGWINTDRYKVIYIVTQTKAGLIKCVIMHTEQKHNERQKYWHRKKRANEQKKD